VNRNKNDVEHYSSDAKPFSDFVPMQKWDTPVNETVNAWFNADRPIAFDSSQIKIWIRQHLDSCAMERYLETRALSAASLLDVMAGYYTSFWTTDLPKHVAFKKKLERLLADVGITLPVLQLNSIIDARNSLVHAGKFVASGENEIYAEYKNLVRLGRSILLRIIGYRSTLHTAIEV
jgi:hypothetical protein